MVDTNIAIFMILYLCKKSVKDRKNVEIDIIPIIINEIKLTIGLQ